MDRSQPHSFGGFPRLPPPPLPPPPPHLYLPLIPSTSIDNDFSEFSCCQSTYLSSSLYSPSQTSSPHFSLFSFQFSPSSNYSTSSISFSSSSSNPSTNSISFSSTPSDPSTDFMSFSSPSSVFPSSNPFSLRHFSEFPFETSSKSLTLPSDSSVKSTSEPPSEPSSKPPCLQCLSSFSSAHFSSSSSFASSSPSSSSTSSSSMRVTASAFIPQNTSNPLLPTPSFSNRLIILLKPKLCYRCGGEGHVSDECTHPDLRCCFYCKKMGHVLNCCPDRKK